MRAFAALLLAGLAVAGCDDPRAATEASAPSRSEVAVPTQGDFDFYVLALSWSPTYCALDDEPNRAQCGQGRSYGFIVHGLWPQRERGYPQDCDRTETDVPAAVRNDIADIMPSHGLVRHQWRKHGSCSGLTARDYFAVVKAAWSRLKIPAEFVSPTQRQISPEQAEQAFRRDNPGLPADGIAVTCRQRHFEEVRVCMTKTLEFRSCREVDARGCRTGSVDLLPPR